jgi:hypothetical protein
MPHIFRPYIFSVSAMILLQGLPVAAHEGDQAGPQTHKQLMTTIENIQSGLMFFKPTAGLRHRAISLLKAERMGLHDAKPGDEVVLVIDESNIMVDLHKKGVEPAGHRLVIGMLSYADPFWEVVEIANSEGKQTLAVDSGAGSKLSVLPLNRPVRAELDEDNIVVDIHPFH